MKEIIEEILHAEKEARARIEAARETAKTNRLKAEETAKDIRSQAREKAAEEARRRIAQAESDAKKEKEDRLKTAAAQSGHPHSRGLEKSAKQVFLRIIGEKED